VPPITDLFYEKYSPRSRHSYSLQSFPQTSDLDPLTLAESYIPEPDLDHSFIYKPSIPRTVFQFLRVDDQLPVEYHGLSSKLYWPSNLAIYDCDPESNLWSSGVHYMGVLWKPIPTLT
jgi:hypothetical protein